MLLSDDMEKEFIRVLGYEKFGLSPQEVMPFLRNLRTHARHVEWKFLTPVLPLGGVPTTKIPFHKVTIFNHVPPTPGEAGRGHSPPFRLARGSKEYGLAAARDVTFD